MKIKNRTFVREIYGRDRIIRRERARNPAHVRE